MSKVQEIPTRAEVDELVAQVEAHPLFGCTFEDTYNTYNVPNALDDITTPLRYAGFDGGEVESYYNPVMELHLGGCSWELGPWCVWVGVWSTEPDRGDDEGCHRGGVDEVTVEFRED